MTETTWGEGELDQEGEDYEDEQPAGEIEMTPGKKLYYALCALGEIDRRQIFSELERQQKVELTKHASSVQKLGILIAFSSLITIETALNIYSGTMDLSKISSITYVAGILLLCGSTVLGMWAILSVYADPSTGMHIWDMEDEIYKNNIEGVNDGVIIGHITSVRQYVIFNRTLQRMIFRVGTLLVIGTMSIIIAILSGVTWQW
ncbi:MAG: hypothetical protein FWH47_01260 [Methanomassiliicoccaceae archaeon]|nr:hypothetical protein [Methanomassiliicoccaceae archaeon]